MINLRKFHVNLHNITKPFVNLRNIMINLQKFYVNLRNIMINVQKFHINLRNITKPFVNL